MHRSDLFARRAFLRGVAPALAAVPLSRVLSGCGATATTPATSDTGASTDSGLVDAPAADTAVVPWATGGTASMKGAYADPFATGLGTACSVYKASTLGPCYAKTLDRQDISEGSLGLPTRLALLVVDPSCKPLSGATVDLWHCSPVGLYSGDDASDMCTSRNAAARAARWFRGVRATNAQGRVDFDTCYPGWYASRTIHIHFTVRVGGTEYVTSQLFFLDLLNDEIIASQPLYKERGGKDTTNAADKVITEAALSDCFFSTAKQADGALLAWKALVVHA